MQGDRAFVTSSLAAELHRKNAFAYDQLTSGQSVYTYVNNNPTNYTDPSGLDVNCAGATCTYSVPGAFSIPFPRPAGFPDTINSNTPYHHLYNVPVNAGSLSTGQLNTGLVNAPTPGQPSPATRQGTLNDATPSSATSAFNLIDRISSFGNDSGGYNNNPVKSYVTTDANTGAQVVLNVTLPGHTLFPGVVARYISQSDAGAIVNNVGEGANWRQAPSIYGFNNPLAKDIMNVWNGQTQGIIDNLGSSGQNLSNFSPMPAGH